MTKPIIHQGENSKGPYVIIEIKEGSHRWYKFTQGETVRLDTDMGRLQRFIDLSET